ncbi:MAG: HlyD family efflux transporter periplasmic adaptor subunit [Cyanobacteria bacterium P01_H01_bin.15]
MNSPNGQNQPNTQSDQLETGTSDPSVATLPSKQAEGDGTFDTEAIQDIPFDQPVVLKQSTKWAKAIAFSIMGVTVFGVIWAATAKIEQVVKGQGQLEPQGQVQEVQAPVNGVVEEVFVKEGDRVEEGELLVVMDTTASRAELASLESIRQTLDKQNQLYGMLTQDQINSKNRLEQIISELELSPEVASLARDRAVLLAENRFYQAQLGGGGELDISQLQRLEASRNELNSRVAAARLEVAQLRKQFAQARTQLNEARTQLTKDRQILSEIKQRNQDSLVQAEASLELEQEVLESIQPLVEEGAIARLQLERQRQEVNDRQAALVDLRSQGIIEYERQQQQIESRLSEVDRFQEETLRLQLDIEQAKEQLTNTSAVSNKEVLDRIAQNEKRIAEIDSQLSRLFLDNKNRIAELEGQISRAQVNLGYQELRAPVTGMVFDLQAARGFVPQPSQAEALLKIVPEDNLVAEVFITNQDIGFVRPGQPADVRIDSFPFSEFGDIKGEIKSVGSDALEPDEVHRFYRFPTIVELNSQELITKDGREIPLQSGMSISVNIKVRENRTVLSLFTELFTQQIESLKEVR